MSKNRNISSKSLSTGDCDCFVLAMEKAMERSGQGIHLSQSVLELASRPDLARLRQAMRLLVERHPELTYQPHYPIPFCPPVLAPSAAPAAEIPLDLWCESGSPGTLRTEGAREIDSFESLLDRRLNMRIDAFHAHGAVNLRCDLVERSRGDHAMVFTWRHILFDGVGAELLTCETAAIASGDGASYVRIAARGVVPPGGEDLSLRERWKRSQPMLKRLDALLERPFKSLSGPIPVEGRSCFELETLSAADTARINAHAATCCGDLFTTPYFLACATVAHHRVWQSREDGVPESYLVTLPLQLRKARARGPLFQNHLTMIFLSAASDLIDDIPALCRAFQEQHARALKERLVDSFRQMQYLMRRMPPRLYIWFLLHQMRGEFNSFYHSNTGEFAPDLDAFYGAKVANAYHIPSLSTPPGTGLFVNTKNGRMTVVMTWREGVISAGECATLKQSFIAALLGDTLSP